MLICKDDKSYQCIKIKSFEVAGTQGILLSILEPVSHTDIANLFEDNTFYLYDDILQCRFPDTNNTKLVGLRIEYNADSTCRIIIKLTKGDVDNESNI